MPLCALPSPAFPSNVPPTIFWSVIPSRPAPVAPLPVIVALASVFVRACQGTPPFATPADVTAAGNVAAGNTIADVRVDP